jgi:hypothetical protein
MTLAQFLNQNSFPLLAAAILISAAIALRILRVRRAFWLLWGSALIIAVAIMLSGRSSPARIFASASQIEQTISGGAFTLVEFFSNY